MPCNKNIRVALQRGQEFYDEYLTAEGNHRTTLVRKLPASEDEEMTLSLHITNLNMFSSTALHVRVCVGCDTVSYAYDYILNGNRLGWLPLVHREERMFLPPPTTVDTGLDNYWMDGGVARTRLTKINRLSGQGTLIRGFALPANRTLLPAPDVVAPGNTTGAAAKAAEINPPDRSEDSSCSGKRTTNDKGSPAHSAPSSRRPKTTTSHPSEQRPLGLSSPDQDDEEVVPPIKSAIVTLRVPNAAVAGAVEKREVPPIVAKQESVALPTPARTPAQADLDARPPARERSVAAVKPAKARVRIDLTEDDDAEPAIVKPELVDGAVVRKPAKRAAETRLQDGEDEEDLEDLVALLDARRRLRAVRKRKRTAVEAGE
ncbi:hypothetical protein LTR08_009174 [Meristemomyces frigidus]|nr:hypothetical protein LTR08_009174 [Meristemomyces frigidus]